MKIIQKLWPAWMLGWLEVHIKGTTLGDRELPNSYLLIDLSAKSTFFFYFTNIIIYHEKGLWIRIVQQGIYKLRDKLTYRGGSRIFMGGGEGGRKRLCARTHIHDITSAKPEVPFGSLVLSLILRIMLRNGHKSIVDQIFFFFFFFFFWGGMGRLLCPLWIRH